MFITAICVFIVPSLIYKPRKPVTQSKKLLCRHLISLIIAQVWSCLGYMLQWPLEWLSVANNMIPFDVCI